MARYTTYDSLRSIKKDLNESLIIANAVKKTHKNVFLSHSSKDKEILPAVIQILENHGGSVYIDKDDSSLPKTVTVKTAEILRATINNCKRMVLLVTSNTKDSLWIPWELGLGDGEISNQNVALFPVTKTSNESYWSEQEYLGLYKRIIWSKFKNKSNKEWMVWDHHNNTATALKSWLL